MGSQIWTREPKWTDESPARLHVLFIAYRDSKGRLSPADDAEFARLLMSLVAMQFRRRAVPRMLAKVRVSAEDVAQDAVMHLRRKSLKGMGLRPVTFGGPEAGWRQFIAVCNTAIYRIALTAYKRGKLLQRREAAKTDHDGARDADDRDPGTPAKPSSAGLVAAIAAAEEDLLGDFVGTAIETQRIERLFRIIARQCANGAPAPYTAAIEVPAQVHMLLVSRVLRFVREYAQTE